MLVIAIDGACRRNGKPTCISSGGVFIQHYNEHGECIATQILSNYEVQSTNQRGELLALLTALDYIWSSKQPTQIVTDSEYIFNAMTKEWFVGWESRQWQTASYEPVKNSDLWREIAQAYRKCQEAGVDIVFYHVKGHCIPFGKVTANTLLSKDCTGELLYIEISKKYDTVASTSRVGQLKAANELSLRNNGFAFEDYKLKHFVCINTMADAIATKCVEAADSLLD